MPIFLMRKIFYLNFKADENIRMFNRPQLFVVNPVWRLYSDLRLRTIMQSQRILYIIITFV